MQYSAGRLTETFDAAYAMDDTLISKKVRSNADCSQQAVISRLAPSVVLYWFYPYIDLDRQGAGGFM